MGPEESPESFLIEDSDFEGFGDYSDEVKEMVDSLVRDIESSEDSYKGIFIERLFPGIIEDKQKDTPFGILAGFVEADELTIGEVIDIINVIDRLGVDGLKRVLSVFNKIYKIDGDIDDSTIAELLVFVGYIRVQLSVLVSFARKVTETLSKLLEL